MLKPPICTFRIPCSASLRLSPFHPEHAAVIAQWVATNKELRWLAPSTPPPLTGEKVAGWPRPDGHALVLSRHGEGEILGYGELNRMHGETGHLWLGHVVIRPDQRGQGTGEEFVRRLLKLAFGRLGANRVSLIVFPDNVAAVRCYVRAGFTITGEEQHRFGSFRRKHKLLRLVSEAPNRA